MNIRQIIKEEIQKFLLKEDNSAEIVDELTHGHNFIEQAADNLRHNNNNDNNQFYADKLDLYCDGIQNLIIKLGGRQ
ncbi:MAG: hypothetical protein ACREQ5_32905 [Candidatus Dormibacteria bacterium]